MPGITPSDSNDTPSRGSTVDQAADNIAKILARDDGEPEPRKPQAPARPDEGDEDQPTETEDETPEEEEGEPEPEDGAEDEEGTDEDEDQEPDEPEATAKAITVEIDGRTLKLTADEIRQGYLRTADYTRKTTALAEERKQLGAHAQAVLTERQQYAALLPALQQQLQSSQAADPNWEELAAIDPVEFNRLWAAKQIRDQKLQAVQSEQHRLAAMQDQEREQRDAQHTAAERERLVAANPAWKDPDKWTADRTALREYAGRYGYTKEELSNVTDHRIVLILHKARLYEEMVERGIKPHPRNVPNLNQQRPASVARSPSPGAAPMRKPVSERTRAKQSLAKTHSIADAARVIGTLI